MHWGSGGDSEDLDGDTALRCTEPRPLNNHVEGHPARNTLMGPSVSKTETSIVLKDWEFGADH